MKPTIDSGVSTGSRRTTRIRTQREKIGRHDVVLSYMPGMGKGAAASVASGLRISYPGVQLALVVGVCGGAPVLPDNRQIYLGDVITSDSVIEYDFGRQYPGGFERKTDSRSTLGRPNREIRSLITGLRTSRARSEFQHEILQHLRAIQDSGPEWCRPISVDDILFHSSFAHKHRFQSSLVQCICFDKDRPDAMRDETLSVGITS